ALRALCSVRSVSASAMSMNRKELEALRKSGEIRNFNVHWLPLGGMPHHEGCRGRVEQIGFPANPNMVVIRDIAGNAHHWHMHYMTAI
ncbi:hypothetical protein, partial [Leifsonia sp. NPDC058248]|uniref:hypothetical protein n=1 Tax=Leifsonia sp. NPDC058248 TaxID=3346402 RepID=UPI0036DD1C3F